jgi:uncharacterized protein YqeY
MRAEIDAAVKTAMKAGDKARLSTLRMMASAIKDRDIAVRTEGRDTVSDEEIAQHFSKMVKQREESARMYDEGGRAELADKERAEIAVIREFMPRQMDDAEVKAAAAAVIAELGATSVKDLGKVMAALKERHAGQMDFGRASGVAKGLLTG